MNVQELELYRTYLRGRTLKELKQSIDRNFASMCAFDDPDASERLNEGYREKTRREMIAHEARP